MKRNPCHHTRYIIIVTCFLGLLHSSIGHSYRQDQPTIAETKHKLQSLDVKIAQLQHELKQATDKKQVLHQALAHIEKDISHQVKEEVDLKARLKQIKPRIKVQNEKINELEDRLKTQQKRLAEYIVNRYKMDENQPLIWILTQKDPYQINHILTLYQYLIKARMKLIEEIKSTQEALNAHYSSLKFEQNEKETLLKRLSQQKQTLQHDKQWQQTLIQRLNKEIKTQHQILIDYQKDHANLTHLLQTLAQKSLHQTKHHFARMRHKLAHPIQAINAPTSPLNQGLFFSAPEGTPVHVVFPGKVIFSDWLKGYGLILIIDHGNGFMSLYAHNQSIFKKTGDLVLENETIAFVGHSGGIKENGLYFEIRQRGKAISPKEWLS